MTGYIVNRLMYGVLLVFAMAVFLFFALHVLGDPVTLMLGEDATPAQVEATRRQFGYDRPLPDQLADYLNDFVRLDFGDSLRYRRSAAVMFQERFPKTLALAGAAAAIAFPLGLLLGIVAGLRPHSVIDRVISVVSFGGISIPSFWLGLMLIVVVAGGMRLLPTSGFGGFEGWRYYILPATALAVRPLGRIAQLTRSALVDVMAKQYITVARGKGLSEPTVIVVHALKNAMNSVITLGAGEVVALLSGSLVIESIFGWPGIGSLMIESITGRDLPVVETCVIAVSVIVVFTNLAVDLLYAYFDPRIVYK